MVAESADFEEKPTASDATCEGCGHGVAGYTINETASADGLPTRFFKCNECGNRGGSTTDLTGPRRSLAAEIAIQST